MNKWMKIKGNLINLSHVMLINKYHKIINGKDKYCIDFTFISDLGRCYSPDDTYDNVLRIPCKDKDDMIETYNEINEFLMRESTYYERNSENCAYSGYTLGSCQP